MGIEFGCRKQVAVSPILRRVRLALYAGLLHSSPAIIIAFRKSEEVCINAIRMLYTNMPFLFIHIVHQSVSYPLNPSDSCPV